MFDIEARLHHSLKAPIPTLSSDFHRRLTQTLQPNLQKTRRQQTLLSAATTAALLLPKNLPWPALALLSLTPLALLTNRKSRAESRIPPVRAGCGDA